MIAVKLDFDHAPRGQAQLREVVSPVREEWQADGTWTGLFDLPEDVDADAFLALAEEVGGEDVRTTEIESEDDIPKYLGGRMSLYLLGDGVPDLETLKETESEG